MVSTASITSRLPKLGGKNLLGKAAMAAIPAIDIFMSMKAFGFERDTSGNKVDGINWGCGTYAVATSAIKNIILFGGASLLMGPALGFSSVMARTIAKSIIPPLAFFTVPSFFEDLFPPVEKQINGACKNAGDSYRASATSLFGSLMGEGLTA